MQKLPTDLISTKEKVQIIKDSITQNCSILRRTDLEEYLTPFDELDVELIKDIDLFRMSTNVLLCKREEIGLKNQIVHANIVILDFENSKFQEDKVLKTEEIEKIKTELKETLILGFKIENVHNIKGPYVLNKGSKKKEKELNYEIKVTYDPLTLNCYHMESLIICSESGEEISRSKIKGFRKAIASDIKVQLMNKKKVDIYNFEEIS